MAWTRGVELRFYPGFARSKSCLARSWNPTGPARNWRDGSGGSPRKTKCCCATISNMEKLGENASLPVPESPKNRITHFPRRGDHDLLGADGRLARCGII